MADSFQTNDSSASGILRNIGVLHSLGVSGYRNADEMNEQHPPAETVVRSEVGGRRQRNGVESPGYGGSREGRDFLHYEDDRPRYGPL